MKFTSFVITLLLLPSLLFGNTDPTPVKGLHTNSPRVHALENATVVLSPGQQIEGATLVIRDGLIEAVGSNVEVPEDARRWDLTDKIVYAGFIDAYSQYGMPEGLKTFRSGGGSEGAARRMQPTPSTLGASAWNLLVSPEQDAFNVFKPNAKAAEGLNDAGFTTVATYPARGIFRGQGLLVHADGSSIKDATIKSQTSQHISFDTWNQSRSERPNDSWIYPVSLMGSIAQVRQTLYDAQWYEKVLEAYGKNPDKMEKPVEDSALAALQSLINQDQWALFKARNELSYQQIQKVADEFDLNYAMLGNGYEYRRTKILRELGKTLILPLSFPKTPHVERPDKSLGVSLEQLQHWKLAPSNAAFLKQAEIPFCFTSHFNSGPTEGLWDSIREIVKRGLSEADALAALTTDPAKLYSVEERLGTIEAGKIANLTIATGNLFRDGKARVSELWIQGNRIEKKAAKEIDLTGGWSFNWSGIEGFKKGKVTGGGGKFSLKAGKATIPLSFQNNELIFAVKPSQLNAGDGEGLVRLQAHVTTDELSGSGLLPSGESFAWSALRMEGEKEEEEKEEEQDPAIPELVFDRYPAGAYGVSGIEQTPTLLVQNATIWTSGPAGKLEEADLLIVDGIIKAVGKDLKAPRDAEILDAEGKHITAGLIDCHSHVGGTGGLNEGGHSITVEVRVGDVLNPADINIYRQLAGGLTTANILHGSANPMGGQSQVIKARWGQDAEGLKLKTAKPSVKFALGENVKRSRDPSSTRYPNSRLGVEQFFVDNFRAAADYERSWEAFNSGNTVVPPRTDLRMAATLEVLNRERIIHIHSYRQDEILMFARLAKQLNLEVGTFQHILEGYKVADALAEINAGASTFSDWWGYKFEVIDAIPYNGKILYDQGVLTSFNSDDVYNAEIASRLNTEAAKAVKYGGLPEEEALKFVTINPAIQLRVDDRVGSLEEGKDGDFVIWSDHPLSSYAYAEQTWIEGTKYFDKEESETQLLQDQENRDQLVQEALKKRIQELKLQSKSAPPKDDPPGDEPPEDPAFWIYHDGTNQYSCAADEEGAHL